jgi:hypothetical protein
MAEGTLSALRRTRGKLLAPHAYLHLTDDIYLFIYVNLVNCRSWDSNP